MTTTWVAALIGLGFLARRGLRLAFWIGIAVYVCDAIALMIVFSVFAVLIFMWFKGQAALRELGEAQGTGRP